MADETMRAARLHGIRDLRVEQLPRPTPGPGQVLLKVAAVGVCGSDVHYYQDGRIGDQVITSPLVLGHECSAWVAATGPGVTGLTAGQLVAVEPAIPCGHCEPCLEGNLNLCLNMRFCGTPPIDGVFSDYIVMPAENCFPLPEGFTPEEGALLEPMGIALHTVSLGPFKAGQLVAVLGAGPIGLLTAAVARASGAGAIYMTEPLPARRQFALDYVADAVFDPQTQDVVAEVLRLTGGRGVDVAFEAAGAPQTPNQAAGMTCRGGQIVIAGIPADDTMVMRAFTVRVKELSIRLVRRMRHTYPRAIRLVQRGAIALKPMVTHTFPLERIGEAFELVSAYADGVVKAVITMD
jgi:L-iditol 2-dehydrogenase